MDWLFRTSLGLVAGTVAGALVMAATTAQAAQYTVIGTEDSTAADNQSPGNGWVGDLFDRVFPGSPYLVASDDEAHFDPFHAGYDISDGLNFSGVPLAWDQVAGGLWTALGNQTWVLPADLSSLGCGGENTTLCEPPGVFVSPVPWVPAALGQWAILESDGSISDVIVTWDYDGAAYLKFCSNPSLFACPEPASLALLSLGLAGLAAFRRRKAA